MQTGNLYSQPTFLIKDTMTLQEILYGTWMPPQETNTTTHRIGFSSAYRYEPPKEREYVKPTPKNATSVLTGAKKTVYAAMKKQTEPVTARAIAFKVKRTTNYCSIIMAELYKLGLLTRKKLHQNGTRLYIYEVKRDSQAV